MNINHILIQTSDLSRMTQFIEKVVGLRVGVRPPFRFTGAWMYYEERPLLHIVEADANSAQSDYLGTQKLGDGGVVDHIAFEGDDYAQLIKRLTSANIDYVERTVPLFQEHQVFVTGPDSLKLEIIFSQNKTPITFS